MKHLISKHHLIDWCVMLTVLSVIGIVGGSLLLGLEIDADIGLTSIVSGVLFGFLGSLGRCIYNIEARLKELRSALDDDALAELDENPYRSS